MQPSSTINGWLIKQGGSKVCRPLAVSLLQRAAGCLSLTPQLIVFFAQGGFKTWKKRWFVLSRDELTYYAQPSRKDLKGVMNITDCVVEHSPPTQVRNRTPLPAKTPAC